MKGDMSRKYGENAISKMKTHSSLNSLSNCQISRAIDALTTIENFKGGKGISKKTDPENKKELQTYVQEALAETGMLLVSGMAWSIYRWIST